MSKELIYWLDGNISEAIKGSATNHVVVKIKDEERGILGMIRVFATEEQAKAHSDNIFPIVAELKGE